jgi:hypothetical protein
MRRRARSFQLALDNPDKLRETIVLGTIVLSDELAHQSRRAGKPGDHFFGDTT